MIFRLAITFALLSLGARAAAADQVGISFPGAPIAGFCSAEMAISVRIENGGDVAVETKFSTRLWQLSSATLAPLGEAAPWWEGHLEARGVTTSTAKVTLPAFRPATRLRLQILNADGTVAGRADFVALPRGWLRSEIAGLPSAPGLYDPQQRLAPALQKLGVELAAIANLAQLSEFRGPVAIIVPISDELSTAQRLAARGTGIVWVAAEAPDPPAALVHCGAPLDAGFAESAAAQFLFGQALRQALRNKQAHAATSSTSAPQSNPGPP